MKPWDGSKKRRSAPTAGKGVADGLRPAPWSTMPLVLVVALLLGSVLIPARETRRIMRLLRETAQFVEPARLLGARLELGLRAESAALEAYAAIR